MVATALGCVSRGAHVAGSKDGPEQAESWPFEGFPHRIDVAIHVVAFAFDAAPHKFCSV